MSRIRAAASMVGVWYAVALHMTWATLLCVTASAEGGTAVSGPAHLFPNRYGLAIILIAVAFCATLGIFHHRIDMTKILLLVPQQLMLGISASSAVRAMIISHYADGVPRAHAFIIADQIPAVLALLAHSATIFLLTYLRAQNKEML